MLKKVAKKCLGQFLKIIKFNFQEEHKRQTTELQQNYEEFKDLFSRPPAAAATPAEDNTSTSEELDESNPFFDAEEEQLDENNPFNDEVEDADQYDKSGKNPFS